jgi:hypothetical protein
MQVARAHTGATATRWDGQASTGPGHHATFQDRGRSGRQMDVREAVEADAEALAAIADAPVDVMRNLVHDRSVRVAVDETDPGPNVDAGEAGAASPRSQPHDGADDRAESVLGFVSFDARPDSVHVTQLDGTPDACTRLLEEPLEFARREGMVVELLVPDDSDAVRSAVEEVGFDERGQGPRFEGQPTVRYRLEP